MILLIEKENIISLIGETYRFKDKIQKIHQLINFHFQKVDIILTNYFFAEKTSYLYLPSK